MTIKQPLTGKQIGRRTVMPIDSCSYVVAKLVTKGLLICLNPEARNSRLYWLTDLGVLCQKRLHQDFALAYEEYDLPSIDWSVYGWVCFNHRAAVVQVLTKPMQPSEMKRKLRQIGSDVRISANNIRDIIRLFHEKQIVRKVPIRKKAHPRYELTDQGLQIQKLLNRARTQL